MPEVAGSAGVGYFGMGLTNAMFGVPLSWH
jgi:hypothetical protein